jgi:protein-disulfide isomerase
LLWKNGHAPDASTCKNAYKQQTGSQVTDTPSEPNLTVPPPHVRAPVVSADAPHIAHRDAAEEQATFTVTGAGLRTAVIALVFLLIGFVGGNLLSGGRLDTAELESIVRAVVSQELANAGGTGGSSAGALTDNDPSFGPEDAPVTIVEFSDFYCTYCTRFATETLPRLQERYGDQLRFVYRDLPIIGGQASVDAAVAGNCAHDQDKFWEFHDLLFANNAARGRDTYISFAGELGMDADAFATCLDDPTKVDEVMLDYVDGQTLGITGTPKFYINGKVISGAQPYDTFALVIDAELTKAGITPPRPAEPDA